MNIPFVDLKAQYASIKPEIDTAIADVIAKTAFIGGAFVKSFEAAFAEFCGAKHCIGVGNGTDALYISLRTLGVGAGDEVITVANSFIATAEAITSTGARVVFVDIDPKTYNIDVNAIESKITERTRAIVPVHLYGQPADMEPILQIAKKHNLKVVEDAAQAHGAEYKGRRIGTIGEMACFSFYPGKNLGAYGDAGAILTNNDELALKARMIANHGRIEKYDHEIEGINSRLDGLQAAILQAKLHHLTVWTECRIRNADLYSKSLASSGLVVPYLLEQTKAVFHLYVVRVPNGAREKLQGLMKSNGIGTGVHYPIPLPYLNAYKYLGHSEDDFPVALKASREIISLPMFPELTEDQIQHVCKKIVEAMC